MLVLVYFNYIFAIPSHWDMASCKLMSGLWLRFLITFFFIYSDHGDKLRLSLNSKVAHLGPLSRWTLHYMVIYHIICNAVMYLICRKRLTLESLIPIVVPSDAMKIVQIGTTQ